MALTNKQKEVAREALYDKIIELFENDGEDIARASKGTTDTTVLNMPVVIDDEEAWFVIAVSIPKGSKTEPYDGYALRDALQAHKTEKAIKAKKREEEKQRKIAKDTAAREAAKKKEEDKTE